MSKAKSPRVFEREFKLAAVKRMQAGESPSALAHELDVRRKLLYEWKQRVADGGAENLRARGRPPGQSGGVVQPAAHNEQRRIAALERLVGKQQALIDFFERALQRVEPQTVGRAESMKRSEKSASKPQEI